VLKFIKDPKVSNMERLRLVTLYALRYEKETENIDLLKEQLSNKSLNDSMISLVDIILEYAGEDQR